MSEKVELSRQQRKSQETREKIFQADSTAAPIGYPSLVAL